MKKWTPHKVGNKTVKYATGTLPRGNGIQIAFAHKGERLQVSWMVDPGLQQNANAASEKRDIILNEIKLEERGHAPFDIAKHFPQYAAKRIVIARQDQNLLVSAMRRWLGSNQAMKLAPSTQEDYKRYVDAYENRWPTLAARDFSIMHLRELIKDKQAGGATLKSISNQLTVIRSTCSMLMDEEMHGFADPFAKLRDADLAPSHAEITARAAAAVEDEIDPYSPKELEKLFSLLSGEMKNHVLAYLEGPRTGELFAAGWDDIDWEGKRLRICRTFSRGRLGPRKNGKEVASYWCMLSDRAMAALRDQKQYTYLLPPVETGTAFGAIRFVFLNPNTKRPWDRSQQFQKFWERLSLRAGIRYRSPYNLRHTCASHLFSCGATARWIADNKLGNSEEMVKKVYAQHMPDVAKQAGIDERAILNKVGSL